MKHRFPFMFLSVLLILSVVVGCTDASSNQSGQTADTSDSISIASEIEIPSIPNVGEESSMTEEDTRLQIGDTVTQPDIEATVTAIEQIGKEVCVTLRMTNKLNTLHQIKLPLQFHLVDAEGERLAAERLEDLTGKDLQAKSIAKDETVEAKAYFTLPDGYTPITFIYTYDYMGFRGAYYKIK